MSRPKSFFGFVLTEERAKDALRNLFYKKVANLLYYMSGTTQTVVWLEYNATYIEHMNLKMFAAHFQPCSSDS